MPGYSIRVLCVRLRTCSWDTREHPRNIASREPHTRGTSAGFSSQVYSHGYATYILGLFLGGSPAFLQQKRQWLYICLISENHVKKAASDSSSSRLNAFLPPPENRPTAGCDAFFGDKLDNCWSATIFSALREHHGETDTAPCVELPIFRRHDYGTFKRSREQTGVGCEINGNGTGTLQK